ncbi:cupin domain-containing protein [Maribellus luteus]|uniref:Cupin domain-containing protein n=1 Tax=Maribellus luteus TaxID=2305463 RepID=A0A399SXH6_9BACT|nr:cupin domain-containing protein [Maribellus luteus]RIJ47389.1 cupin domain-containing protein [Maribellus luteus]
MASILKSKDREFREDANKIDPFRLMSDTSRSRKGIKPQNLNFDLRQLNPGQFSAPYHFHRYAEELFMIVSGTMTLRCPEGMEVVEKGDLIFFEMGEAGGHQFYNHSDEPCIYLDVRTFIGYDVCEYPDSNKVLLAPSFEIFSKETAVQYFKGEEKVMEKWKQAGGKGE